jgi:hypothetical protein
MSRLFTEIRFQGLSEICVCGIHILQQLAISYYFVYEEEDFNRAEQINIQVQ